MTDRTVTTAAHVPGSVVALDFGVLFDDMLVPGGGVVDVATLIAPKAEAEVAFVLKHDLGPTEFTTSKWITNLDRDISHG